MITQHVTSHLFDCVSVELKKIWFDITILNEDDHRAIIDVDIDAEELKKKFLECIDVDRLNEDWEKESK